MIIKQICCLSEFDQVFYGNCLTGFKRNVRCDPCQDRLGSVAVICRVIQRVIAGTNVLTDKQKEQAQEYLKEVLAEGRMKG